MFVSNEVISAGARGADAERTNRSVAAPIRPLAATAILEMIAGTALIHVTSKWSTNAPEIGPVESVIEDECGAGDERREQADHFGVDVPQGERIESTIVRGETVVSRDVRRRVHQLSFTQRDDLGRAGRS